MGREYCGTVEEIGSASSLVSFTFLASDYIWPNCHGYQSSYQHAEFVGTAQAPILRVLLADGTLVATPDVASDDMALWRVTAGIGSERINLNHPNCCQDERSYSISER
jgi:hypothetical protein